MSGEFFIAYNNHPRLDASGFAPFGRVVKGMEVVDAIERIPTDGRDRPLDGTLISATVRPSCARPSGSRGRTMAPTWCGAGPGPGPSVVQAARATGPERCASPRTSPSRLPQRRLSYRRLPTFAADLLRVSR